MVKKPCFWVYLKHRRNLVCAVSKGAEEAFKKTVEVDRLIDILSDASPKEVRICGFSCYNLNLLNALISIIVMVSKQILTIYL